MYYEYRKFIFKLWELNKKEGRGGGKEVIFASQPRKMKAC